MVGEAAVAALQAPEIPLSYVVSGIFSVIVALVAGAYMIRNTRTGAKEARRAKAEPTFAELATSWQESLTEQRALRVDLTKHEQEFAEYQEKTDAALHQSQSKLSAMSRVLLAVARQAPPGFKPRLARVDVILLENDLPFEWTEHQPHPAAGPEEGGTNAH